MNTRRSQARGPEPILPLLLVLFVTLAAYGLSKSHLIPTIFSPEKTPLSETQTLSEFKRTYFTDHGMPTPTPEETVRESKEAPVVATYIEITGSCGPHYEGTCVNARSEPSTSSPALVKLRNGIMLRTDGVVADESGNTWHRVIFDEWVRYPERTRTPFYVHNEFVTPHTITITSSPDSSEKSAQKKIVIDRSEQRLIAYHNDGTVFIDEHISTGLDATPTPRGTFTVFYKTPSRYMQGPLPGISNDYYDLPGVPWNLYFTHEGGAIHGAYWHDKFGQKWSHGCVNLPLDKARTLYEWAELGTTVIIRD